MSVTPNNFFIAMPQNKPSVYLTLTSPKKKRVACLSWPLLVFFLISMKAKNAASVAPVPSKKPLVTRTSSKKTDPPNKGGSLWGLIWYNMSMKHARHNSRKGCKWCVHFSLKIMSLSLDVHVHSQKKRIQEVHYLKQTTSFTPEIAIPEFYNERSLTPLFPQGLCNVWWRHQHHFIPAPLACFFA